MTPDAVAAHLAQLGGLATRRRLRSKVSRRAVAAAVGEGAILRLARGRYAVPGLPDGRRAAATLNGVLTLRSAALHHGWEVRTPPARPTVTVPRGRTIAPDRRKGIDVSWRTLAPDDVVDGWVTSPLRTVIDCARLLPPEEGLAVADSALRHRAVTRAALSAAAAALPQQHIRRARVVLTNASALADNPFESALRAIALQVPHTQFVPQHPVYVEEDVALHPDVADARLRISLEADSFEHHGKRWQLASDCRRYNQFVVRGWTVLRFSWEDVMFGAEWVHACVTAAVELRGGGRAVPEGIPLLDPDHAA